MIAKRESEDAHDRTVTLVWLGESLRRQKQLKDLKTLLTKRAPEKQNHKQMRTMLHQIAEHYGLKVRKQVRRG